MHIGIVAEATDRPSALGDAVETVGATPVIASMTELAEDSLTAIIADTNEAVRLVAQSPIAVPVLPVAVAPGLAPIEFAAVPDALTTIANETAAVVNRPLLGVQTSADRYSGVFDLAVVTQDPATISEFSVSHAGEDVTACRADGLVIATPTGSTGYSRAAGGPRLAPELAAVAVVPIAPYRTRFSHWVLDGPITVRVLRDEAPVVAVLDGKQIGEVTEKNPITIDIAGTLQTFRVPASASPLD